MREVTIQEFAGARADGAFAVDVRERHEYEAGHVPGVVLIPMGEVLGNLDRIPRHEPVYVICASGNRSRTVAAELSRLGYDGRTVAGGTSGWQSAGLPVVRGARSDVA